MRTPTHRCTDGESPRRSTPQKPVNEDRESDPLALALALAKKATPVALHDPLFQYSESKNPYWRKCQELPGWIRQDLQTEAFQGHWREQFQQPPTPEARPKLHVEIGCNTGLVSLGLAKKDNAALFIGIDWKFKVIYRAAEKAQKQSAKNLLFFRAHAERLQFMFGKGEVDRLALYFPDPWPKKAQQKNRFFRTDTLDRIHGVLSAGGEFHIKTDHAGYFDWMLECLSKRSPQSASPFPWEILRQSRNLHANHPNPSRLDIPDVTLFEKLFIRDGLPIHELLIRPLVGEKNLS